MSIGKPLAHYAAYKRAGDYVFMSGVIAVDPAAQVVVTGYAQIPEAARQELAALGYVTGQMSVDVFEAPIVAQSWFVLNRIREMARECGGGMQDVARLVQYFRDLRHYPDYNRVRGLFFAEPVVSTVVEASRMLPSDAVLVEVEATLYLPRS
jgi:enamine deaminase RidA (YjgF/YER057c/UK114 family)